MKNLYKLLIMLNFTLTNNTMAAPPVPQVKSAYLEVAQGKTIYANGKMQAVVNLFVELLPNVTWDHKVIFYEVGTGKNITDLGWTVSDTDNGYDHNIGSMGAYNISSKDGEVIKRYSYITRYISTTKPNENIKICFQITTRKVKALQYTNCDLSEIGIAAIFAKEPEIYYANDFEFTKLQKSFQVKISTGFGQGDLDITGYTSSLRPTHNIPTSTQFKIINTKDIIVIDQVNTKGFEENSTKAAVRWYNLKNISKWTRYKEKYLYKVTEDSTETGQKSFEFNYVNLDDPLSYRKEIVFSSSSDSLVDILTIDLHRDTFMYKNERCREPSHNLHFYCYYYDHTSKTVKGKPEPKTINLKTKDSYKFKLEDNYGNQIEIVWQAIVDAPIIAKPIGEF